MSLSFESTWLFWVHLREFRKSTWGHVHLWYADADDAVVQMQKMQDSKDADMQMQMQNSTDADADDAQTSTHVHDCLLYTSPSPRD